MTRSIERGICFREHVLLIWELGAATGMGGIWKGRISKNLLLPQQVRERMEEVRVQGRQCGCRLHPHPCGASPGVARAAPLAPWHPQGETGRLLWLRLSSMRGASVSLRPHYSLAQLR